ncbi:MAG: hypothetical protein WB660_08490 [Candidatus Sulfotelmatobacter sp.]
MEALTRLVTDSLARQGLDRPVDPRRLQWSRWFRCDSIHSLLIVPSKPGIFALAEEVLGGAALQRCDSQPQVDTSLAAEATPAKRMLAVLQFSEDDDMAFVLDRMFTRINPMRARLASGRCFLRFVVITDEDQRRSICTALNQWLLTSAEKATGIDADFSSSLELASVGRTGPEIQSKAADIVPDRVGRTLLSATADSIPIPAQIPQPIPRMNSIYPAPPLDSGANKNLHCPNPFPSGF